MKGILLTSHGNLAEGMRDTLTLFSGEMRQFDTLTLSGGQDIPDFTGKLMEKIDSVDTGEGVVVFCDLAFGTPSNMVAKLATSEKYKGKLHIITGMNLPMILEYSQLRDDNVDFNDMIDTGKNGIINLNESLNLN